MTILTDDNNRINNDKEKEDFFARFDKISNEFDKSINQNKNKYSKIKEEFSDLIEKNKEGLDIDNFENNNTNRNNNDFLLDNDTSKTRLERLSRSKNRKKPNPIIQKIENIKNQFFNKNSNTDSSTEGELSMTKRKRKKKYIVNKKQLFKFITLCFLVFCLIIGAIVTSIIATAPPIEPDNIYSLLAENSIIYDDEGNVVDSLMTSDGLRTNISYSDLPQDLIDAFVAIEDKKAVTYAGDYDYYQEEKTKLKKLVFYEENQPLKEKTAEIKETRVAVKKGGNNRKILLEKEIGELEEELTGIKEKQNTIEEHYDEWLLLEERRKSAEVLLEKKMEKWLEICN